MGELSWWVTFGILFKGIVEFHLSHHSGLLADGHYNLFTLQALVWLLMISLRLRLNLAPFCESKLSRLWPECLPNAFSLVYSLCR